VLDEPHLIVTAVTVAADTAVEADYLMATHRMFKHGIHTGRRYGVLTPEDALEHPDYPAALANAGTNTIFGTADDVVDGLDKLAVEMDAAELMITLPIADVDQRLRSLDLTARAWFESTAELT